MAKCKSMFESRNRKQAATYSCGFNRRHRLHAICFVLGAGLLFASNIHLFAEIGKPREMTAETALKALETDNGRLIIGLGNRARVDGWIALCADELRYLSKSRENVDDRLVALAESARPLDVRCRAVVALAKRNVDEGIAIVVRWATSDRVLERLACWAVLERCGDYRQIDKHMSPEMTLSLYRDESDNTVREAMEIYFHQRKAEFAVADLCKTVEDPTYRGSIAIDALAEIGDRRAVKSLLRCRSHIEFVFIALGQLGGPEAVDFLLANAHHGDTVRALGEAGDVRAIPVLRERLRAMTEAGKAGTWRDDGESDAGSEAIELIEGDIMQTRLALLLLTSRNVTESLIKVAETKQASPEYRLMALHAMRHRNITSVTSRVLRLYKDEQSSAMGRECIRLLKDQPGEEVTNALITHLAAVYSPESPKSVRLSGTREEGPLIEQLRSAIHGRIGNRLFEISELNPL